MAITVLQEDFEVHTDWGQSGTVVATCAGRTGPGVRLGTATTVLTYTIPGASESGTVFVGTAWKVDSLAANRSIIGLKSDTAGTTHLTLVATTTGALEIRRGTSTGTVLQTTAAGAVAINAWYYIEVYGKLGDSPNGAYTVRINGTPVLNGTSVDTKNAGTKTVFDSVAISSITAASASFDDLYIVTGTDGAFLGDQQYGTGPFDVVHEPFANLTAWTTVTGSPAIGAGRHGNAVWLDGSDRIRLPIPSGKRASYMIVGFALHTSALPAATTDFVDFRAGEPSASSWTLRCSSTGVLTVKTSVATTAAGVITTGTWKYIEAKVLLQSGRSAAEIWANDAMVGTSSGVSIDSLVPDCVEIIPIGTGTTRIDDFYLLTGHKSAREGDQEIDEPAAGSTVKVWNGSAFVAATAVKLWNGTAFVDAAAVKVWNGSAFVDAV